MNLKFQGLKLITNLSLEIEYYCNNIFTLLSKYQHE